MVAPCYDPYQMDQVLSLINDQLECITLKTVMLDLGVGRPAARQLLEDAAGRCQSRETEGYDVTRILTARTTAADSRSSSANDGVSRTKVRLVTERMSDDGATKPEGSIYSICRVELDHGDKDDVNENGDRVEASDFSTSRSIQAAHEKALTNHREMLNDGNNGDSFFQIVMPTCDEDGSIVPSAVIPAPEAYPDYVGDDDCRGAYRVRRVKRGRGTPPPPSAAAVPSIPAAEVGSAPIVPNNRVIKERTSSNRKVTTASAFFGAAKTQKPKGGKTALKTVEDQKVNEVEENVDSAKSNENHNFNGEKKKVTKRVPPRGPKKKSSLVKATSKNCEESEENESVKGNADDFIGDVDEDEDFVREDQSRKQRNAVEARKQVRKEINDPAARKRVKAPLSSKRSLKAPTTSGEERGVGSVEGDGDGANNCKNGECDEEIQDGMDMEYDDVDGKVAVKGAMDAFAKTADESDLNKQHGRSDTSSGGTKKRMKKLVERTTVDANGYMHTESVTVWEDASDNEGATGGGGTSSVMPSAKHVQERAPPVRSKPAAGKKVGGKKKQAGLMGFFAKKKE